MRYHYVLVNRTELRDEPLQFLTVMILGFDLNSNLFTSIAKYFPFARQGNNPLETVMEVNDNPLINLLESLGGYGNLETFVPG
jgi:hypothetical protein